MRRPPNKTTAHGHTAIPKVLALIESILSDATDYRSMRFIAPRLAETIDTSMVLAKEVCSHSPFGYGTVDQSRLFHFIYLLRLIKCPIIDFGSVPPSA